MEPAVQDAAVARSPLLLGQAWMRVRYSFEEASRRPPRVSAPLRDVGSWYAWWSIAMQMEAVWTE